MTHILVVEPDAGRRSALTHALNDAGFEVTAIADVDAGFSPLGRVDAVVCSEVLPSGSGLRLVRYTSAAPVILTAVGGSVPAAVAAIKAGAAHYLVHPIDASELVGVVQLEIASRRASPEHGTAYPRALGDTTLVGRCDAMTLVRERLHAVARLDSPVLVIGEVGTGKESVARAIHADSRRRNEPLLTLNTVRVPSPLLAAELFGIEPGSFDATPQGRAGLIESADRGTLVIEDVADLPLDLQSRLLRVIEDGSTAREGGREVRRIDVRIIAATRVDIRAEAEAGRFHGGLLRHLAGSTLGLPPLRERGEDLIDLAQALLARACARLKRPEPQLADDALMAIRDYSWPGNVRELENAIERAVILNAGGPLAATDLGIELPHARPLTAPFNEDATTLEDYFVRFVTEHEDTLTETELAQKLGISRKSLWERRQRLNIPRRRTHTRGPRRDD